MNKYCRILTEGEKLQMVCTHWYYDAETDKIVDALLPPNKDGSCQCSICGYVYSKDPSQYSMDETYAMITDACQNYKRINVENYKRFKQDISMLKSYIKFTEQLVDVKINNKTDDI